MTLLVRQVLQLPPANNKSSARSMEAFQ